MSTPYRTLAPGAPESAPSAAIDLGRSGVMPPMLEDRGSVVRNYLPWLEMRGQRAICPGCHAELDLTFVSEVSQLLEWAWVHRDHRAAEPSPDPRSPRDNQDVHERFAPDGDEAGWMLVAMNDPRLRRGIWVRRDGTALELCSGREGGDAFVRLEVGATIDATTLAALHDVLDVGRWMVEGDSERLLALDKQLEDERAKSPA